MFYVGNTQHKQQHYNIIKSGAIKLSLGTEIEIKTIASNKAIEILIKAARDKGY